MPELVSDQNYDTVEHKLNLQSNLQTTVAKYLQYQSLENMANILEALNGLLALDGLTLYDLEKQRIKQHVSNCGFEL